MTGRQVTITRKELYALVWAESLSQVGRRYGLSEYRLRQLCIRMEIPMPRATYWDKLVPIKDKVMVPLPAGYRGDPAVALMLAQSETSEPALSERGKVLDPLVESVKDTLLKNTKDRYGIRDGLVFGASGQMDIRVAPPTIERACRFMDRFLRALRARGHTLTINGNTTSVLVEKEVLPLVCREKRIRVSGSAGRPWHTTELQPTGILALEMGNIFHPKEWKDGTVSLEGQIPGILDKLEAVSRLITSEKLEWARQRAEQEEKERIRREPELRRENEQKNFKNLLRAVERWQRAALLREYLAAVEGSEAISPEKRHWLAWGRGKADWYDPLVNGPDEWLTETDKEHF